MPGAVGAVLRELGLEGYAGGNVTVPHKEEAFAPVITSRIAPALPGREHVLV